MNIDAILAACDLSEEEIGLLYSAETARYIKRKIEAVLKSPSFYKDNRTHAFAPGVFFEAACRYCGMSADFEIHKC